MSQVQQATRVGMALLLTALALTPACTVRTYDTPYYYRQPQPQPRRAYYTTPQQPGYYRTPAENAYGGAAYGRPAQPQYAAGAMGGARYGGPAQPQYAVGAMGGASYGAPAQPQYAPGPPATVSYGPPPAPQPQPMSSQPVSAPQPMMGQPGAIWVPADNPNPVWSNETLMPGQWYVVEAWGVFSCWPNYNDGVDPYYAYAPWNAGTQPQAWGQLLLNDRPMFETARANRHNVNFRPDHKYSTLIVGNGARLKLQILDARNGSWGDNRGGVWVRVYPAQRRPY